MSRWFIFMRGDHKTCAGNFLRHEARSRCRWIHNNTYMFKELDFNLERMESHFACIQIWWQTKIKFHSTYCTFANFLLMELRMTTLRWMQSDGKHVLSSSCLRWLWSVRSFYARWVGLYAKKALQGADFYSILSKRPQVRMPCIQKDSRSHKVLN